MENPNICQVCNKVFEKNEQIHIKHKYHMCEECVEYLNEMEDEIQKELKTKRKERYGKYKYYFRDFKAQEIVDMILANEFNSFDWE